MFEIIKKNKLRYSIILVLFGLLVVGYIRGDRWIALAVTMVAVFLAAAIPFKK